MRIRLALVSLVAALLPALTAGPALALDIFLNGAKVDDLRNADLSNCTVKFDAQGNIHIISPGYRIVLDKDGKARVTGSSDLAGAKAAQAGKLAMRYVLSYTPNPKVNFMFDVYVNGKLFRKIGLDQGPFTVELSQDLIVGNNSVRVVGKPGDAPPSGTEADAAALRIFRGSENADGVFIARHPPVWEMMRVAVDRDSVDRTYNVIAE